jgi:putative glutamine amidotransferase
MTRAFGRPRILLNCDLRLEPGAPDDRRAVRVYEPYVNAVIEAGGLPILVPPAKPEVLRAYLALADGALFTGGDDYPPALYGEKAQDTVKPQNAERTASDIDLYRLVRDSGKPALGVCAGLQLFAIAEKGALIQHLAHAEAHTRRGDKDRSHSVRLEPGTRLRAIFGKRELVVNSAHHQAADPRRLPAALRVAAEAADGTIEGLELKDAGKRFFISVQWHPERIADAAHRRRLFGALVAACGQAQGKA